MMGHGLGKDKATVSKTVLSGGGTHMLHHSDLQGFRGISDNGSTPGLHSGSESSILSFSTNLRYLND